MSGKGGSPGAGTSDSGIRSTNGGKATLWAAHTGFVNGRPAESRTQTRASQCAPNLARWVETVTHLPGSPVNIVRASRFHAKEYHECGPFTGTPPASTSGCGADNRHCSSHTSSSHPTRK